MFDCVRERTEKYRVGDSFKCAYDEKVMFLSRLNAATGGCEKIVAVSGSFWSR